MAVFLLPTAVAGLDDAPPKFIQFGKAVSGGSNSGKIHEWRCLTVLHELEGLRVGMNVDGA